MNGLLDALAQLSEMKAAGMSVSSGDTPVLISGLSLIHKVQASAVLSHLTGKPLLIVCSDEQECDRFSQDLTVLLGISPVVLPGREWNFRPVAASSRQWEYRRMAALYRITSENPSVIIASVDSLAQCCIPATLLTSSALTLSIGGHYDIEKLSSHLLSVGYTRCEQVEGPGQYAQRGGILDIFSPQSDRPIRCEFFDDEIDSMGFFDISNQRREQNCQNSLILPAGEVLPFIRPNQTEQVIKRLRQAAAKLSKKEGTAAVCKTLENDADSLSQSIVPEGCDRFFAALYSERTTPLSYLENDRLVIISEGAQIGSALKNYLLRFREDAVAASEAGFLSLEFSNLHLTESELQEALLRFPSCELDSLLSGHPFLSPKQLLHITAKQLSSYGGSLETACTDMVHYLTAGYRVLVLCGGEVRAKNLLQILSQRSIRSALDLKGDHLPERNSVLISIGALSSGCEYPELKLAILTEGQLLSTSSGKTIKPKVRQKRSGQQALLSYNDLKPGDLVVHTSHGIGRFVGIVRLPVDGIEKDYMKVSYAGTDYLYVPCTSLDLISKYIGTGEDTEHVRLNKLGGTDWTKTKSRAKAAAKDMAEGLIALYAQRQRMQGHAFSPDSPWQQEFEEAFEYEETPDQLRCIEEIKTDMEQPIPMDRLLCGDVGYGKTEVALRAAMKCILDGKQVAILVPTTVLAQQHYVTACNRFRSFPVNVEVLSRFRTGKQLSSVYDRIKSGQIDLLIGTHKLLQENVQFKNLGLLIIDEEQRFGVAAKERLREKVRQVDTLTLSATPIPRTLNMALSGIRDMSTLEEPPLDRQPVQTYVLEHDWGVVAEAIRREISRGGQVYYLHNRVEDIESTVGHLRQLLGDDITIAIAHGKMQERDLSRVMQKTADGEIQLLVCTTIIETGIDIPNVNTLIIEDADHMGLSQLHQIRGRIGRSARHAYAYLTYRTGKVLTEVATKRLNAIREYVEFGAGFKIAMRDLEIRGAGNLLGAEQSGYMSSVGYDMYLHLLNDAVLEQQGKSAEIHRDCSADLTVSANIPEKYIRSAEQRMDFYRRIAAIRTSEDADELQDELTDRFGDPPKSVQSLLDIALLRSKASLAGITDISQKGRKIVFSFDQSIDISCLLAVFSMTRYHKKILMSAGDHPYFTFYLQPSDESLVSCARLIDDVLQKKQESTNNQL